MTKYENKYELGKVEITFIVVIIMSILAVGWFALRLNSRQANIDSFDACVAGGNPIMETYPEQCTANGKTFTNPEQQISFPEPISGEMAYADLPASLQSAIAESIKDKCVTGQITEGLLNSQVVASRPSYKENKYAQIKMLCGDNAQKGLFAYMNGSWILVGATSGGNFLCSDLKGHNIPSSYIADCIETGGSLPIPNPVSS